jgi:uncharacterized protein
MREEVLPILACPECRGELELVAEGRNGEEITSGKLHCKSCGHVYPIEVGIPNFIPEHAFKP